MQKWLKVWSSIRQYLGSVIKRTQIVHLGAYRSSIWGALPLPRILPYYRSMVKWIENQVKFSRNLSLSVVDIECLVIWDCKWHFTLNAKCYSPDFVINSFWKLRKSDLSVCWVLILDQRKYSDVFLWVTCCISFNCCNLQKDSVNWLCCAHVTSSLI